MLANGLSYDGSKRVGMQETEGRNTPCQRLPFQSPLMLNPGNKFHALSGNRKGQYAISINKQWRVCFEWNDGNTYHVEITDYH